MIRFSFLLFSLLALALPQANVLAAPGDLCGGLTTQTNQLNIAERDFPISRDSLSQSICESRQSLEKVKVASCRDAGVRSPRPAACFRSDSRSSKSYCDRLSDAYDIYNAAEDFMVANRSEASSWPTDLCRQYMTAVSQISLVLSNLSGPLVKKCDLSPINLSLPPSEYPCNLRS